jgi:quercetin dioxygenase-like cupin family protein
MLIGLLRIDKSRTEDRDHHTPSSIREFIFGTSLPAVTRLFNAWPVILVEALAFPASLILQTRIMKIIRLYTGTDNESHFEEKEVDFKFTGDTEVSATEPAAGIIFRRAPTTHLSDFHPAPRRQYVITLSGQVEIETGDGTVKRFGPGDVMLAEDTTGHGHITRVVGNQPRIYVMIPLK